MYLSASITLYSHSPVLIPVMQWYLLSIALSVNVVNSLPALPDDFQPFGTEISYNTPDLQVPTIDTGLLKIYQPGSPDVPVTFLDEIPTDLEVVPAELASEGSSCLGRRDTEETEGRIDKRAMCATPSPTQKEPATRYPPSDGRGYPRPVHTPTVLDPNDADPITKPARKPRQKPPGPVPLHPSIDRVYDNPFIADLNGRTKICASRLMTLCCWGPIIKPMTTQMDIDNCQKCACALLPFYSFLTFPPSHQDMS